MLKMTYKVLSKVSVLEVFSALEVFYPHLTFLQGMTLNLI